jgi:HSP20 family protein
LGLIRSIVSEFSMSRFPLRTNLFDELFREPSPGFLVRPLHGDALPERIRLDVKESPEAYTVLAEMPGVAKDDIHVDIEGGLVTLRAEVKQHDAQREGERVVRSERYYGSVARSIQLPVDIDEAGAAAKYDNGVLTLSLPKRRSQPGQKRVRID